MRAAVIAVFFRQFAQVILDECQDLLGVGQQVFQVGDLQLDLFVFVLDLLAFQGCQAAQLHVQDGLGLQFAQLEALHQAFFGRLGIRGFADGLDDRVQVVQGDDQAFQDVGPGAGFLQFELGAAGDDCLAVFDEDLQDALERQQARFAVHQRQHLHAEGGSAAGCICRAG